METFVGDTITIDLNCHLDISGYTDFIIKFKRPNNSFGFWTAALVGTDHMDYDCLHTDLNMAGIWAIQAHVEGGGEHLHGDWVEFTVKDPMPESSTPPTTVPPTTEAP